MSIVEQAERFAQQAHREQYRKGGEKIPYFSHLASVAGRLREAGYGGDEVVLAAAYLHDVLEDQPQHGAEAHALFPREVMAVVERLSEQKTDAHGNKRPKAERFAGYADALEGDGDDARRAAIVSCADKIDNTRSILDAERRGVRMLMTLSTRPGEHRLQFARLRPIYERSVNRALLAGFDQATADLEAHIARWLPGRAVEIAASAHLGQFDRAGEAYILHPLRVMSRARTASEKMVAVLHDVVEDTPWTLEKLAREGFSREVIDALDALTKREGEGYDAFLDRVVENPLATRVKRLDLEDNMNVARLDRLTPRDSERLEKYIRAHRRILKLLGEDT